MGKITLLSWGCLCTTATKHPSLIWLPKTDIMKLHKCQQCMLPVSHSKLNSYSIDAKFCNPARCRQHHSASQPRLPACQSLPPSFSTQLTSMPHQHDSHNQAWLMTHLIVNKARAAVHNGMVVQQLDISRLQLHVHSELIQSCQAVELCKSGQLGRGEAGDL